MEGKRSSDVPGLMQALSLVCGMPADPLTTRIVDACSWIDDVGSIFEIHDDRKGKGRKVRWQGWSWSDEVIM